MAPRFGVPVEEVARPAAGEAVPLRPRFGTLVEDEEPVPTQTVMGSVGRGLAAAPISLAQGVTELGAAALDISLGTDTSRRVSEAFEGFKDDFGLIPERTAGKVAEEMMAFGLGFIPIAGWLGRASSVARGAPVLPARSRFLRSADDFGGSEMGARLLNTRVKLAAGTALSAGIFEAAVSWDGRGTISDAFEAAPDFLKTEDYNPLSDPREEAARRLENRLRLGAEGVVTGALFEAAFPVLGIVGRSMSQVPGVPQAAGFLHDLIYRRIGGAVADLPGVRKVFASAGPLPPVANDVMLDTLKNQEGAMTMAFTAWQNFEKAAKEVVGIQNLFKKRSFDIKEAREDLFQYLTGDGAAFRIMASRRGYSPKDVQRLEGAAQQMRDHIDSLSDALYQEVKASTANIRMPDGGTTELLLSQIEAGMGKYIRRLYDAFDNPGRYLDPKVYETPAYKAAQADVALILSNANPKFSDQVVGGLQRGSPNEAAVEMATRIIDDIVTKGAMSSAQPFDVALREAHKALKQGLDEGRTGRIQLFRMAEGIFAPRVKLMDMSKPLREFMGEIRDPQQAYMRTVEDLSQTITNLRMYEDLKDRFAKPFTREMLQSGAPRPMIMNMNDLRTVAVEQVDERWMATGRLQPGKPLSPDDMWSFEADVAQSIRSMTKGYVHLPAREIAQTEGALDTFMTQEVFGRYGALSDTYVSNDLYEALTMPVRAHALLPDLWSAAVMLKGMSQMVRVVLNPVAQVRDALSQGFLLAANGNIMRDMDLSDSARLVFNSLSNMDNNLYRQRLVQMHALGVLDESVVAREISQNRLDAKSAADPDSWLASFQRGLDRLSNLMTFGGRAERLYSGTDSVGKILGVTAEQSKYATAFSKAGLDIDGLSEPARNALVESGLFRRSDLSQSVISMGRQGLGRTPVPDIRFSDVVAADIVKDTMPTYSKVPQFIKSLRRLPLGNFVAFPAEVVRNTSNIFDQGLRELSFTAPASLVEEIGEQAARALEKQVRAIGSKRLVSYTAMAGSVPLAVQRAGMMSMGMGDEEMDALYAQAAPWFKGHTLVPVSWDRNGKVEFIDYSYMNPWDFALAPARAALQAYNETGAMTADMATQLRQAAWAGIKEFAEPFAGEAMMIERLMDVLPPGYGRGGRTTLGAYVYRQEESFGSQMQKGFTHMLAGFLPQYSEYLSQVRGGQFTPGVLTRAWYGIPDNQGRMADTYAEAAAIISGVRGNTLNLRDSFQYSGAEYGVARANISSAFNNRAKLPSATEESVVEAFLNAQENRYRAQSRLFADIQAARALGMSDREIRRKLQQDPEGGLGARLGNRELSMIMRGQFDPLMPSPQLVADIRKASRNPERVRLMERLNARELAQIAREQRGRALDPEVVRQQRREDVWQNGVDLIAAMTGEQGVSTPGSTPPRPAFGTPVAPPPPPPASAPASAPAAATGPFSGLFGRTEADAARNLEIAQRLGL
jgi:hypothetical protein